MQTQKDPNTGKTVKVKVKTKNGALLMLDEGEALTRMGVERKGTTILTTLRSAYSGETLGQTNASQDTRRVVQAGDYRLVLLVGLQDVTAHRLLADSDAGTPQRVVMFNANDPAIPENAPVVPPPWKSAPWVPAGIVGGKTMTLAPDVLAEVRTRSLAVQRGTLALDPLDSHRDQNRIKEAAMLAILDHRVAISDDDWRLAGMVMDTSDAIRRWIIERSRAAGRRDEDARTDRDVRRQRAVGQAVSNDAHERAVDRGLGRWPTALPGRHQPRRRCAS
jgi:hypothetical protein